jgi:DNA-binding GntR family transcriptional regulator
MMGVDQLDDLLTPPPVRSLGDDIAERLRAAILSGHFEPGERLGEERLARMMHVSRGPIRDALSRLERQGLVVIKRNKGAFVARLTPEDLDELYTLRLAIERLALQRACAEADAAEIAGMQQLVDEIAAHTRTGISEQLAADLDLRFHDLIYQAAHHRRLRETWSQIRPQIHILLLSRNVVDRDFRDLVVDAHQQLLDAIRDRDASRAVAILDDHLHGSYQRVLASLTAREHASALAGQPVPDGEDA